MHNRYIYSVGKADLGAQSIERIHQLGFKAGLFADQTVRHKHKDAYDRVIEVDFNSLDDELTRLAQLNLSIQGLICTYENYVTAKALLGAHFNVPTISLTSARASTDKAQMRQAFIDYDPSISPQFTTIDNEHQLLAFARRVQYPLIIKPAHLVKSLLVMRCDDEQQLVDNYRYAKTTIADLYAAHHIYGREPTIIVEEFITGQMYSIAAFVNQKGIPSFCPDVVQLTTAQQRGVDDNYLYSRELPALIESSLHAKLLDAATKGVAALQLTSSPAHIELIESHGVVKLIEIGARIGGYRPRMYQLGYGIDMASLELQTALGDIENISGTARAHVAVFELFPRSEGTFSHISGIDENTPFTYFSIKAKQGEHIGPARHGYKAVAVIIIATSSKREYDTLCQLVDTMQVEIQS